MVPANAPKFVLENPPIVEAVLDIDCDFPPKQRFDTLELSTRELFHDVYPKFRMQLFQEHEIETKPGQPPKLSQRAGVRAFQFLNDEEKQLIQVRLQGFSFNRLAPYTNLDEYLPEIERAWRLYVGLTSPIRITSIRLRYINRILLPILQGKLKLEDYLTVGPRLPDPDGMTFVGFFDQHTALEIGTGNLVNTVLTAQMPQNEGLPVIFDNTVTSKSVEEPGNWAGVLAKIQVLRELKNRVFRKTLTEKCLTLFQQP